MTSAASHMNFRGVNSILGFLIHHYTTGRKFQMPHVQKAAYMLQILCDLSTECCFSVLPEHQVSFVFPFPPPSIIKQLFRIPFMFSALNWVVQFEIFVLSGPSNSTLF